MNAGRLAERPRSARVTAFGLVEVRIRRLGEVGLIIGR